MRLTTASQHDGTAGGERRRRRRPATTGAAAAAAALAALLAPAAALAQGGTGSPPAGGGELTEIVLGTIGGTILMAAMLFVVVGHRMGRLAFVDRAAAFAEQRTGIPGWASLPIAVHGLALLTAVFGMYWDISTHIDSGRDPGPFANASHYFILLGLFGILFAGLLAIFIPRERPGETAVRVPGGWHAPLGGLLIFICAAFALSGFPLDDVWHRIFGQDVTLWGPTHLLLFGAAGLSVVGGWVLVAEGLRARGSIDRSLPRPRYTRVRQALLAGGFLVALSTFQGEFDFAVPQFRLDLQPILLMIAAGIGLVAARVQIGRGGALLAVAGFIAIRGVLALFVGPIFGHTTLHFPLYLVEALAVEAVARFVPRERPLALGAAAGAAIGTAGLAAEWAWSYIWWTIPWPASMLPEAALAGFVAAVAGGVIGAFAGRALASPEIDFRPAPRPALPAAALALVAVLAWAVPISGGDPVRAQVTLADAAPAPERAVNAQVRLDPPDAADGARWFNATAWQGRDKAVVDELEETAPGVWRTTQPIPVHGNWKSTLRLHTGSAVQGMALYFPEDRAIPAPEVAAEPRFEREFVRDVKLLQREQKPGVPGWLAAFAYITVLLIGLGLVASLAWGLYRLDRRRALVRVRGAHA